MTTLPTPYVSAVVTMRADADLWAAARLVPTIPTQTPITILRTLPAGSVSISRDWRGRALVWLPTHDVPWPSDLTAGQVAKAIALRHKIPAMPFAEGECLALRAVLLNAGQARPCPFCQFDPHLATCPVAVLGAGRWLSMEAT